MGSAQTSFSWPQVLGPLLDGRDLSAAAAGWAMTEILRGQASEAQLAGFVVALRVKGESVDEVEGLAEAMYDHCTPVSVSGRTLDVVGTGGDRARTVNISTMAALVAAGAGARIVKHGNRAASSACGTADVLAELGVPLDLDAGQVAQVAERCGMAFCFAPAFHPGLRHAAGPRRELGVPTTFNFLGPLANPARPAAQAVGVADARMAGLMAGVLARRGVDAMVFHGDDGLDELTTTTTSQVWSVGGGVADGPIRFDPRDLGLAVVEPKALVGGDATFNAAVVRDVLSGRTGPVRDVVLLNAAAALAAFRPSSEPLTRRLGTGLAQAAESIDSGAAAGVLDNWVRTCARVRAGSPDG